MQQIAGWLEKLGLGQYAPVTESPVEKSLVLLNRADAHRAKREFDLVTRDLDEALELDAKNEKYIAMFRGIAFLDNRQPEAAIEQFQRAINSGLRTARLYLNQGLAFEQAGYLKHARKSYSAATTLPTLDINERKSVEQSRERLAAIGVQPTLKAPR
jgi:tetratricopeptide (TPR) repeat protein